MRFIKAPAITATRVPSQGFPLSHGGGETRRRPHQHHALEPEVDHAGPLPHDLAERGVQERHPGEYRAGQHAQDGQPRHDVRLPNSDGRARTTNSVPASRMLITAKGRLLVSCRTSPPARITATTNDISTIPSG